MRLRPRAILIEVAIIVSLGLVLAAASVGLLVSQYGGRLHFGLADLLTVAAAGIVTAAAVRLTARLHRRWKRTVGRVTAAVVLCAVAAVAGTLVVMLPSECPGGIGMGRCGIQEAAAWGEVAGLAALVNFMLAGLTVAFLRLVRGVVRDGSAQGIGWIKELDGMFRRRAGKGMAGAGTAGRPRDPQEPKGRPTPRRADAERTRRERLRGA